MKMKILLVLATVLTTAGLSGTAQACIGGEIPETVKTELANQIVADSFTHNNLKLTNVSRIEITGFPSRYGVRGDCGALWLGLTIAANFGDPLCTTSITYRQVRWSSGRTEKPVISRATEVCE